MRHNYVIITFIHRSRLLLDRANQVQCGANEPPIQPCPAANAYQSKYSFDNYLQEKHIPTCSQMVEFF